MPRLLRPALRSPGTGTLNARSPVRARQYLPASDRINRLSQPSQEGSREDVGLAPHLRTVPSPLTDARPVASDRLLPLTRPGGFFSAISPTSALAVGPAITGHIRMPEKKPATGEGRA
jgi:hypothetical protein